ncbi:MAG: cystathionine beta-lyase [Rhodobiaceae bacterium]|nr:cystathionine beta-lyase [Rhodobiaceae bacterium]MCC0015075.1 cystathionine beta-lyase [Rhodobiaceae bacterium]MCC0052916.1 cystathionine beta-lyase [Rhodobiaceae bacterium]
MAGAKPKNARGRGTTIVTSGRTPEDYFGFVNPPVYHGSTVLYPDVATLKSRQQRYTYGRRGSPTTEALEAALTELDGGAGTVLVPSGLAAISLTILTVVKSGGHILVTDNAYQPTRNFCNTVLKQLGIETTYFDPRAGAGIAELFRDNTELVFTEAPGSQTFEMQDVPAIAAAARARGIAVAMDNTWATPLYFRPIEHGVDFAVYAGTKYVVGHSDAMLGTVTANEAWWKRLHDTWGNMGLAAGPDDVYLAQRGLRTMHLRLARHMASALEIARWLETRPEVSRVLHPGLESHPGHAIWKRDFSGASGLFSMIMKPGPDAAVAAFLDDLAYFGLGYSWGGFESLAIPFDCASYRTATRFEAEGPAIRLHIGLEDVADLRADLEAGLDRWRAAGGAG